MLPSHTSPLSQNGRPICFLLSTGPLVAYLEEIAKDLEEFRGPRSSSANSEPVPILGVVEGKTTACAAGLRALHIV
ncbi:hypothetical protein FKM82_018287 [Ascaphus truei]